MNNPQCHVRWMIKRDMPEVVEIEAACFEDPWEEEDFKRKLRHRTCIGMIAENEDGQVIGFMVYELHKRHLRLVNLGVHPEHRLLNVGRILIAHLIKKLSYVQARRTAILLECRETNLGALNFFKALGFLATGLERESFADTGEDAILFEYLLRQETTANA